LTNTWSFSRARNVFISRPRWAKCGQYIEGGEERWKELSSDKTSDDMVDILLAEITGTDIAVIQAGSNAAEEFFEGQVNQSIENQKVLHGNTA
jgi:hypothetical protein